MQLGEKKFGFSYSLREGLQPINDHSLYSSIRPNKVTQSLGAQLLGVSLSGTREFYTSHGVYGYKKGSEVYKGSVQLPTVVAPGLSVGGEWATDGKHKHGFSSSFGAAALLGFNLSGFIGFETINGHASVH